MDAFQGDSRPLPTAVAAASVAAAPMRAGSFYFSERLHSDTGEAAAASGVPVQVGAAGGAERCRAEWAAPRMVWQLHSSSAYSPSSSAVASWYCRRDREGRQGGAWSGSRREGGSREGGSSLF